MYFVWMLVTAIIVFVLLDLFDSSMEEACKITIAIVASLIWPILVAFIPITICVAGIYFLSKNLSTIIKRSFKK